MAKSLTAAKLCPMEIGLNILSGKWNLKILWHISKGPARFNQLQKSLGKITTKTLTQQLRELEAQGIISRTVYPTVPLKVEYSLTALGNSILPVFGVLCDFGNNYLSDNNRQLMNESY